MKWNKLTEESQLLEIKELSKQKLILIFKHSTRCSISSMALNRLERKWSLPEETIMPFILDLIAFRNVSNRIVDFFEVSHQSPQVIVLKNGKSIYNASHMSISFDDIKAAII
jgi:bacillithiol system protein YtxJ